MSKKISISLCHLHVSLTCVLLSTENGPHYHNTAVLAYLSEVNEVFNVNLLEYNNFEAGEGKTALDTHFAHISHKIVRYVRLGNDLETGEELGQLVQVNVCDCICSTLNFCVICAFIFMMNI